ncbi:MAG: SigB/SigF/SigG family RNA polymerase sigma factor [Acidimicrobiales bacterium]
MSINGDSREESRLKFAEFARTRDPELRTQLIEAHLALAAHLARRYGSRGEPLDDLIQVSSMALVKAVERFDPRREVEFSTYATHTIVGELKRHFRDKGWAVRAPRRLQELYLSLNQAVSVLSQRLGRSPSIPELAAEVGVSMEEALEALEAGHAYRFASLDSPGNGEEEHEGLLASLGELDQGHAKVEDRAVLEPLMSELAPRERVILGLRFFGGLTQSEIAGRLGISQMQVSRLLARSLEELRQRARSQRATGSEQAGPASSSLGHHVH